MANDEAEDRIEDGGAGDLYDRKRLTVWLDPDEPALPAAHKCPSCGRVFTQGAPFTNRDWCNAEAARMGKGFYVKTSAGGQVAVCKA